MEKKVKGPKVETGKRVPFNWARLKKMWDENRSYVEMAKALDAHYDPDGDDPTKSVRAKVSVAMNKGVKVDGTLLHFKRRSKAAPVQESKPKPKAKKSATKKKKASPSTQKSVNKGKTATPATQGTAKKEKTASPAPQDSATPPVTEA